MGGEHAGALEANLGALRIHRELGDRRGEAGDAGNIAQVYRGMKRFDEALRWAQKAARIDRELGDKLGEGFRLNTTATVHQERGELEAALSLHLRALSLVTGAGAKNLSVAQHMNCGRLYLRLGDPGRALEHFGAAGRLSRKMGYSRDEGYSQVNVGVALERLGDPAGATDAYRRAVELLEAAEEESGSPEEQFGKAEALVLLGRVLHRSLDRSSEALEAYEAAVGIYRELGDAERLCRLLLNLGGLRWKAGRPGESARDYEEALKLAQERGEASHEAAALASLSVVHRDRGLLTESLRCGRQAARLVRDLEDLRAEAYVLASLAESYQKFGYHKSALSCLKRSLRLRQQTGDKPGEVGMLRDLARVYEKLGDEDRARAALRDAARKEETLREKEVRYAGRSS
jgi:tetratricopeptide (TPR) repeat protein